MMNRFDFALLLLTAFASVQTISGRDCGCTCEKIERNVPICDILQTLNNAVTVNTNKLATWNSNIAFVSRLKQKWRMDVKEIIKEFLEDVEQKKENEVIDFQLSHV